MNIKEKQWQFATNEVVVWFKNNGREFPWRMESSTPYQILLSEILLQKTKAGNVESIYSDFIKEYPSMESVYLSKLEKIEKIISPLGLGNQRSKRIFNLSKAIVEDFEGSIPSDYNILVKLPGIGTYIANAFLCFAFNKSRPLIDANIERILSRSYGLKLKNKMWKSKKYWEFVEKIIPAYDAKSFNRGLIDLGALVCKPRNPECGRCPISTNCFYLNEKGGIN